MKLDAVTDEILKKIDDYGFKQEGACNLRYNGQALCHGDTEHIKIRRKTDKKGINVYISKETQGEEVHIPVVVNASGMTDIVYNDFYIEGGANVTIVAGCGIHNAGCDAARHDGIHAFHVGKGATVTYAEKHYGEGEGTGEKILNPVTQIYLEEDAVFNLDSAQIGGVDSTVRKTEVTLAENAKLNVMEKLMTHDKQTAVSDMTVELNGAGSTARIISRSVAKGTSVQTFHPIAVGNALCHAHVQCDSIIMDQAQISSIPEINARNIDAQIIHEAAIGRINNGQILKLRTFGLTEEEAEAVIIEDFLA